MITWTKNEDGERFLWFKNRKVKETEITKQLIDRIEELQEGIMQHRMDIWGELDVENEFDLDLYRLLESK